MQKETDNKNFQAKRAQRRMFHGTVISNRMEKTLVVRVDRMVVHPRYRKRYHVSKNYKVHDEKNQYKPGDEVRFYETRPLSKEKRWRVMY